MTDDKKSRGDKPQYEAPLLVPLGEMARGFGAWCSTGSKAGQGAGNCAMGRPATGRCFAGNGANIGGGAPARRGPAFR